jgi:hypothetical protein
MDVFDSDQFHSTSFDLAKLCGTVLCEKEGRSPFLKNLGRLGRPYFLRMEPCESGLAGSGLTLKIASEICFCGDDKIMNFGDRLLCPSQRPLFLIVIAISAGAPEQMFV